jgi:mannose-6-phosphate isomerase-like protein (cupin superfamily)
MSIERGFFRDLEKGQLYPITFREDEQVAEGVVCKCYDFTNDNSRDLGIITMQKGSRTPRQIVRKGDTTIEAVVSGKGLLIVKRPDNSTICYPASEGFSMNVQVGEEMQWCNTGDEELVVYEICVPPYSEGRFENIG